MRKANATVSKGSNGRSANGRFLPGCKPGPGNPHAQATADFRRALHEVVSEKDFREVAKQLLEIAKSGEGWAIRELFDRVLGKPTQPVEQNIELAGGAKAHLELARVATVEELESLEKIFAGIAMRDVSEQ